MKLFKTASLLILSVLGLMSVNGKEKMIEVGAKAPDFKVAGEGETEYSLAKQLEQGPVVLVFYRSGDW